MQACVGGVPCLEREGRAVTVASAQLLLYEHFHLLRGSWTRWCDGGLAGKKNRKQSTNPVRPHVFVGGMPTDPFT